MHQALRRRLAPLADVVARGRDRAVALSGVPADDPFWTRRWPALLAWLGVLACLAAIPLAASFDDAARLWEARTPLWRILTRLGNSDWLLIPSGLAVLLLTAHQLTAARAGGRDVGASLDRLAFFFAAIAGTGLTALALKYGLGWPRPGYDALDAARPLGLDPAYASFPSGHSTTAAAMAATVTLLWPRLRVPVWALALAIALSRVMMGAHHLSDIVAGLSLGGWGTIVVARLFARYDRTFDLDGAGWPRARRHDTVTLAGDMLAAGRSAAVAAGRAIRAVLDRLVRRTDR